MARIQLELPDRFLYTVELPVRVSDLNYGAHVGHDAILTLMQEARVIFYRSLGYRDELSFEGPVGQVITDVAIQYKAEGFLGDIFLIHIVVADFNKYGFDMLYKIENKANGKEIARGKTGIVCFDYSRHKIAALPESLKKRLTNDQPST
jgi:acyl-CoA thioester hydrolase